MTTDDSGKFEEIRRRHIADTRAFTDQAVGRLDWSRGQVLEEQTGRLRALVAHAQESSRYYRDRLAGLDPASLDARDLSRLPILTKQDVMDNWDDIVTDPRLRLAEVSQHLEDLHEGRKHNAYYLDEYFVAATGGTSGKRGVFVWDWEMGIVNPNIHYRWEAKHDRDNAPTRPRRTAVICAGSYVHASRFLFPTMVDSERDARIFPAGTLIATMVEELNAYQPDRIVGYASIVEELAEQAIAGRLTIEPERISTNSEPLEKSGRELARQAWGIDIHNSWGSVEIGLAAYEGPSFDGLSLSEDFSIFEMVDDQDQAVTDPEKADRVLVTKLYGATMPIIRYEMTDTLILDDGPNPDAPGVRRIKRIEGRADVWFVYGPTKVHPMVFRDVLGQLQSIGEYQVQQTIDGARILAIAHADLNVESAESAVRDALINAGVPNARVSVESVEDLPRHPQSNKLKRFVPLAAT